ncbi:Uncharacterised protein [Mycobacterium tuberculosis]|uniref:Uncharacterized protein n=1 Tax=Mycobacterium tuberculosis TaxID=1773 RepID=A0A0U0SRB1_MYCTX|nr:Uncharacterised protein [Mycobacterium tuberculosis]COW96720.1 Uncharacterised protein [Mycobacterium tuberculosis]COX09395.1 Uncharacterised protein [Mycobacterium tuberculosis]
MRPGDVVESIESRAIVGDADGGFRAVLGRRLKIPSDEHLVTLRCTVGVGYVDQD